MSNHHPPTPPHTCSLNPSGKFSLNFNEALGLGPSFEDGSEGGSSVSRLATDDSRSCSGHQKNQAATPSYTHTYTERLRRNAPQYQGCLSLSGGGS